MADTVFDTIVSNNLEEVRMIANSEQTFYYHVYNHENSPINLTNAIIEVLIFKYGDPEYLHDTLSGSIVGSNPDMNEFYVNFSGSGLSGVYQQQVRVIDIHGHIHIPSQGKIIIFPSPSD